MFGFLCFISGNIYSAALTCSQTVNINYNQGSGAILTPGGFGMAISTAVIRLHDKQRMFKKVNPGKGGLS